MFNLYSEKIENIDDKYYRSCCAYVLDSITQDWKIETYTNISSMEIGGMFDKDIRYTCFICDGHNKIIKNHVRSHNNHFVYMIRDRFNTITKNKRACFSFLKDVK